MRHPCVTGDRPGNESGNVQGFPALQLYSTHQGGVTIITVQGEVVENDGEDALREVLLQTTRSDAPERDIVVDLSEATYLSEMALALLIGAYKAQRARGRTLHLVRPSPHVRRKLERAALNKFFFRDED